MDYAQYDVNMVTCPECGCFLLSLLYDKEGNLHAECADCEHDWVIQEKKKE